MSKFSVGDRVVVNVPDETHRHGKFGTVDWICEVDLFGDRIGNWDVCIITEHNGRELYMNSELLTVEEARNL